MENQNSTYYGRNVKDHDPDKYLEYILKKNWENDMKKMQEKTCGEHRTPVNSKKNKETNSKENRAFSKGVAVALAAVAATIGIISLTEKVVNRIEYVQDAKEATSIAEEAAIERLQSLGLATTSKDGDVVILDENDYTDLNLQTAEELYIYRSVLDDNDEFNKLLQETSYNNGLYNYIDLEQFLRINGFIDLETGAPSTSVWKNEVEKTLVSAYRSGEIYSIITGNNQNQTASDSNSSYYTDYYDNSHSEGRGR